MNITIDGIVFGILAVFFAGKIGMGLGVKIKNFLLTTALCFSTGGFSVILVMLFFHGEKEGRWTYPAGMILILFLSWIVMIFGGWLGIKYKKKKG